MTFEKRCLIEPSDFISVQYECSNCRAAIVVPIEKLNPDQIASIARAVCSHCQTATGFQVGTQEMNVLLQFNVYLRERLRAL